MYCKFSVHIIFIILFFYLSTFFVYADEKVEREIKKPQSIRELWKDINTLEQEKNLLVFKWKTFVVWWNSLSDLVRAEVSDAEKAEIEQVLNSYLDQKNIYTEELNAALENQDEGEYIEDIKSNMIQNKIWFYSGLLPYIEASKAEEFKLYIDSDLKLNEKSREVSVDIDRKNIERQERVEVLQERIKDNKELLRYNIEERVNKLVQSRLEEFTKKESFINLSNEQKIEVFDRLVVKIDILIDKLEALENTTSVVEEKIILYQVVQDILQWFIDSWK